MSMLQRVEKVFLHLALFGAGQSTVRGSNVVVDMVRLGHAWNRDGRSWMADRVFQQKLRPA